MLTTQRERLADSYEQCDAIVRDYYASTVAHRDVPPIDFDWEHYLRLELNRMVLFVAARDTNELIGFVFYLMMKHPHHRTVPMAICDTIAVRPAYRGRGIARSMMACAEDLLRDLGMERVAHMYRAVYGDDARALFPQLGYALWETTYMKVLSAH